MTDLPFVRDPEQAEEWRKNAQRLGVQAYRQWDAIRDTAEPLPTEVADLLVKTEAAEQRWRDLSGDQESCLFGERGCAPEGPGLAWCQACTRPNDTDAHKGR